MDRIFVLIAAILGFTGVASGAFGAHALRERLTPADLAIFETAVRYQLIHAVALLGIAAVWARWPSVASTTALAGWLIVAGVAVFSGSLYVLVFSGVRTFGAVTPFGGLALLAGWATLAWAVYRAGPSA